MSQAPEETSWHWPPPDWREGHWRPVRFTATVTDAAGNYTYRHFTVYVRSRHHDRHVHRGRHAA
jgi:hypothetical protein